MTKPDVEFVDNSTEDSDVSDENQDLTENSDSEVSESLSEHDSEPTIRRSKTMKTTKIQSKKIKYKLPRQEQSINPFLSLGSNLEIARHTLHAASRPSSLPCRESQFYEILGYLQSAIEADISGVPGTGKTATVLSVVSELINLQQQEELRDFDFLEINGMKLTDPAQSYAMLWNTLTGDHVSAKHAASLLDKYFGSKLRKNSRPCVVLIDELDQFITKNQKVIYNFFDWPNRPNSNLICIAIANTMDLPERVMLNRVSSRIGLTRMNFYPYTFNELIEIIKSRLAGLNCIKDDAIEFCARKVSSISGDARRALDICRRAIDIIQDDKSTKGVVTLDVVRAACKELFNSSALLSLKTASLHQKIFLAAVMKRIRISGLNFVEFEQVYHEHCAICKQVGLTAPRVTDIDLVCNQLGVWKWLVVESGKVNLKRKIRLNIMEEDILSVINNDSNKLIRDIMRKSSS